MDSGYIVMPLTGTNGLAITERQELGLNLSSTLLGGSNKSRVWRLFNMLTTGYVSAYDNLRFEYPQTDKMS